MAGRPRINPGGVLIGIRARISKEDLELLNELEYNPGQALREFCSQKRRTMLKSCLNMEELDKRLEETDKTLDKLYAEKAELMNQLEQLKKIEAENEAWRDNIDEAKRVTINRLFENRETIKRKGPGYKEKINYCIAPMPEGSITAEGVLTFFGCFKKKLPTLNDLESLLY